MLEHSVEEARVVRNLTSDSFKSVEGQGDVWEKRCGQASGKRHQS